MGVHLFIDGIEGECTADSHDKWIDLQSWSWGVSNSSSVSTGTGMSRGTSSIQDLNITKAMDKASSKIFISCCTGKVFPEIKLHCTSVQGDDVPETWLEIILTDCIVTSCQENGSSYEPGGSESISIAFKELSQDVFTQDEKGKLKSSGVKTYDVAGTKGTQ